FLEEGTMVEKGRPILKLSNPTLEQNILTQEARLFEQINNMENTRLNLENRAIRNRQELMRVELNLRETERQYEKQKVLFERGLTSQDLFEGARDRYQNDQKRRSFALETVRQDSLYRINQLAALDTSARSLRRQLEHVRRPLENLTVRAPIAGQLSQLNAEIGQLMNRGRRIGQVDVLDAYKMRVGIDEFYITRITKGLKGTIEIGDETYGLTIRRVFPEVLEGQFEVDMDFVDATPQSIRRGQTEQIR
ncbi:MAG: HlyD family efflux transporter periplasmic adaptor subunit, partial [Candidatus Latescibacteria bacterium]|nr:HlyD family efflux transporter periplasmic adaptor subunit [Candidatus Latescibacterota bacterium]